MDLLLHPETRRQLDAYLALPAHAVLLEGASGGGKGATAAWLIAQLLQLDAEKLPAHAYFLKIEPQNNTISIETVRGIQDFIKLRTTGTGTIRRAIVIEDAHRMTTEAQNAFLKLLEEPPADTVIIMTAPPNQTLLPTIYSRVQRLQVKSLDKEELLEYFTANGKPTADAQRAYYASNGQIGLMQALLDEDIEHPLVAGIESAKSIMTLDTFHRMAMADSLAKNKDQLPDLLQALQRVCHAVLVQSSEKGQEPQVRKMHKSLKRITEAQAQLRHNPNTKLLVTDLLLNL